MKSPVKQSGISQNLLFLCVLSVFGSAHAEEEEIEQFIKPESSISVGLGKDLGNSLGRTLFTQYSGLRKDSASLLLDFDIVKRDDATGLWTIFQGYNLGLDNRELSLSRNKQGGWKYFAEYSEWVRHDPRTINTGLMFAGTTTPAVASLPVPGNGADLNLNIKRQNISLGGEHWFAPNLMVEIVAKNEERDGAHLSGNGIACSNIISGIPCTGGTAGAILMFLEPVKATTRQIEAKLNYSGEKFSLSGGYYGSFFNNVNSFLTPSVAGNLVNPNGTLLNTGADPGSGLLGYLQQPVALPPNNEAHQFYVSGNYAVTPTTRATFKYANTHATQRESFGSMGSSVASNLGGVVDSSLLQLGVTARPVAKLSVLANVQYEDKADKTPLASYNGAYTNNLNSLKKMFGKLEASYLLPDNYRVTLGVDSATVNRSRPVASALLPNDSLSGLREDTKEQGYHAELRRSLSETLNASIGYWQSNRDGGNWLSMGTNAATGTFPMTMTDRKRDKWKASADWAPLDIVSLQFMLENGKDRYTSPSNKGLRESAMSSYGVDAILTLSEKWKLTGYLNQSNQILYVDHFVGYMAELEEANTTTGLGLTFNPSGKLAMGADWSFIQDSNRYKQSMATGAPIVGGGLPDITYRMSSMKLFGKYTLQKNTTLRVDVLRQIVSFNEWGWGFTGTPFTYSDNTTVSMNPNQNMTFIGASFVYHFR